MADRKLFSHFKIASRALLPYFVFALVLAVALKTRSAYAASYLGSGWDQYLGGLKRFGDTTKNGEDLAIDLVKNLIRIVRYIIGAIAVLVAIIYGLYMVTARGKEDVIQKQRDNLLYLVLGFVILILAETVAGLFQPGSAVSGALIDFEKTNDQLRSVVNYIKYLFGFILLVIMTGSGVMIVTANGEEEKITKQKEVMGYSALAALIIMLADKIVDAVYVVKSPGQYAVGSTTSTIEEIASVIRLILAFLGPVAIAVTLGAGFYYLTSMGVEDKTKKARGLIIGGVTGIIVIYVANAIVNTVVTSSVGVLPVAP